MTSVGRMVAERPYGILNAMKNRVSNGTDHNKGSPFYIQW